MNKKEKLLSEIKRTRNYNKLLDYVNATIIPKIYEIAEAEETNKEKQELPLIINKLTSDYILEINS